MDRLVDQAGGPGAPRRGGTTEARAGAAEAEMDESGVLDGTDESDAQDIESELYCSTREAGIVAAGFVPIPDA